MGLAGVPKSEVPRICAEIDERVGALLNRPIEGSWPYPWIDATHVKVREGGRILSTAVIIAIVEIAPGTLVVAARLSGHHERHGQGHQPPSRSWPSLAAG
jgi:putative transposase